MAEERVLNIVIPFLPPSSNKIYVSGRGGMRFLSKKAKEFKTRTISHIQANHMADISRLDPGATYRVEYAFYFPPEELLNKTFGSGKKDLATTRYKRMDVENRLKLVSDALSTAIGIDDCQFFEGSHSKLSFNLNGGTPMVNISVFKVAPEKYGV